MLGQTTQHLTAEAQQLFPLIVASALHLLGAIAIIVIGFWIAGKVHLFIVKALGRARNFDEMLKGFFGSIAYYFVLTITLLAVLSQFGIQTTSLVAVIGAAGLAVGLALQGTLTNLAAGVMLLIFRPFQIGHHVLVSGIDGTVKQLTLFWTELVTADNVQVIIPNGSVWGQALRNFSTYPALPHTASVRFPIAETAKLDSVTKTIQSIVNAAPRVLKDPAPTVLLDRSGTDNALGVTVTFACDIDDTALVQSDLIRAVHDALQGGEARRDTA
ncbi:MAG TPA: mechanosensitive ion channel domain-containing protein [Acetobacteraceae bacterium]|nr:mechanosensitive ion channel domain-containing protein [Acetobacteraceae bacterium]